jgi:hypothetical protein
LHDVASWHAKPPVHAAGVPGVQVPEPSHAPSGVSWPMLQLTLPQLVVPLG